MTDRITADILVEAFYLAKPDFDDLKDRIEEAAAAHKATVTVDGRLYLAPHTDLWSTIRGLVDWLDAENGRDQHEIAMRVLKLTEEAGEVAQAYIGMQGQNPRKGVTHTAADLQDELCDVIVTAAVALASLTDSPQDVLAAKLAKITARVGKAE